MHMHCSKIGLKMFKRVQGVQYTVHPLTKLSHSYRLSTSGRKIKCVGKFSNTRKDRVADCDMLQGMLSTLTFEFATTPRSSQ
jgi:hypothetical protein